MRHGAVVEVDDAVGKWFRGEQLERNKAMARLNQWDAFADQDGDDVDAVARQGLSNQSECFLLLAAMLEDVSEKVS